MRSSIAIATFMALGAGTVGAGALDAVPSMVGSDTLKNLTIQVLNNCTALHTLGDPIKYDGGGSGAGENALKIITGATQLIAPMSRALGNAICTGPTPAQRAGAEGMIVALDGLAIVGNAANVGTEGIDYPGTAQDPANQWRTVLRLIYTGIDIASGNNVFLRDCNSAARKAIVNNWDNVFHGTVTSCTDSHPSVPGSGAAGYDANNAIVEPGVRHAFRRDDESGTTDVFLGQLSLTGVNFAQAAPAGSNTVQAAVYRALAGSPFCNNKRPEDKWAPVTLPANTTLGFNASQIPEMTNVGVPAGAGTGLGFSTQLAGSANAKNLAPYLNEYTDQDPIRRKCVGRGNNANAALPMEQVCSADGTLGVVLPITIPAELTTAQRYPSLPCEPGLGFAFGPSLTRPTTAPMRCPNGDATQDGQCLLPVRTDATQPNGVAFDCINPPNNVPLAIFDTDGDGSQFTDAPATDGRTDVDGRVYNLVLRKADGSIVNVTRNDPSKVGVIQTPVAAAYYRIHTTRSLLLPPNHATSTCATQDDATDEIGCLTLASPCSIGYAGKGAVTNNAGTTAALVNGIPNNTATVRALVSGGLTYPIARKLYLNTVQGFEVLHNSSATVAGTDAEEEMAKCYSTLLFNGTINVESPSIGFVKLPPATGATVEKPLCEDFNGASTSLCSDAANTDACLGNDAISGGTIPSSLCDNGLKDGAETGVDVCQSGTTCNTTTHHCQ
ncbi:MAG: hypothetical protein ABUL62_15660 [Myxococcales bacterium]